MSSTQELSKPTFVKVKDLEKFGSGYNVYVKVVSAEVKEIETKDGQKIKMVDALVGDQTAVAKAFFKGENANFAEKGNIIAIRNGLKKYIKNFISLELDIFGRVTKQSIDITVDQSYNISEKEHKRPEKPRGFRNFSQGRRYNNNTQFNRKSNYNPPRKFDDRPRREGYDRQPRRFNDRPPRREVDDRKPRRQGYDRQWLNENDRPPRDNNYDRRNDRNDRGPRRENYNRTYDKDFDRNNGGRNLDRRKYYPNDYPNDRPPRREQTSRYQPKRQQYRERAPIIWTKIEEISPGDDRLNLIVKVISQQLVQTKTKPMIRATIGDQTGTVRAFLTDNPTLRVGKSVALFDCQALVIKEHIEIQCRGKIDTARREVDRVNEKFNLSDKSWVKVVQ